ncbi:MAG: sporulation protein YqfD [Clostridia bacterium]|nr:sporulation protein YqfD [Clostridia bacterium]
MRIDLLLLGFVEYEVKEEQAARLFEWWRSRGFSPKSLKRCEKNATIRFFVPYARHREYFPENLPHRECSRGGLPVLLAASRKRPGLWLGLMLALLLTVVGHQMVWDVTVEGNQAIPTEELMAELSAVGVKKGVWIPTLDEDAISTALRVGDRRIGYAAVNRRGTVITLTVVEAAEGDREADREPADLVAKSDGVVLMPLVYAGQVLVREGDVVRAGQVLATGLLESEKNGPRLTRAEGQVLARTSHTYTVTVPFDYEKKQYVGRVGREFEIFFFSFVGKVFKTTGNSILECDIIKSIKWATLPTGQNLPIGCAVTTWQPYQWVAARRSAAEAYTLAMRQLEERIAADSAERTLLSRTVETVVDDEGITLICTLVCEEDIALVAPITVQNPF